MDGVAHPIHQPHVQAVWAPHRVFRAQDAGFVRRGGLSLVHSLAEYPISFFMIPLGVEPTLTLARRELRDDLGLVFN